MNTISDFQKIQWEKEIIGLKPGGALRVLIILSQQPSETGSGIYLREVVRELKKAGHQPFVLAAHYRQLNSSDFSGINSKNLSTVVFDNGKNSKLSDIKFPIPGMSLDMPYKHKPFHELSEEMLKQYLGIWKEKVKNAINMARPHILHINHLWLLPSIVADIAPWMPVVATYHGSEYNILQKDRRFLKLIIPGIQRLDTIISVSIDGTEQLQESFGVQKKRTVIIGNGYNPSLFRILKTDFLAGLLKKKRINVSWKKLVLFVGKFADYKGLPYLIQASKNYTSKNNDILTLIVGDGSKNVQFKLREMIKKNKLSKNVIMVGKTPYEKVAEIMNAADVFVLPSINEPFGLVLLEALACGVRAVAAKRGGPDFFVPKVLSKKGLVSLIEPLKISADGKIERKDEVRYVKDMANAIQTHLETNVTKSERQFISQSVCKQTWRVKTKEIIQIYHKAIIGRRPESF